MYGYENEELEAKLYSISFPIPRYPGDKHLWSNLKDTVVKF